MARAGGMPGGPKKDDENNKEQFKKKYHSMQEVFDKEEFGRELEGNVEKIEGKGYQGQQAYRATKDMPRYGIKKGDKMYLDGKHRDHIEVFKAGNQPGSEPRAVISVDGRSLPEKLKQAIDQGRECPF